MTDPKRTCGNCDYFTTGIPGHGTCHVAAPGSIARNGFPIIAASDWCAKGATGGEVWNPVAFPGSVTVSCELLDALVVERQSDTTRVRLLLERNLWQRICNTVPWEGK